jgi:hypothetical protein
MKVILMLAITLFASNCSKKEPSEEAPNKTSEVKINAKQATEVLKALAAKHFFEVADVYRNRVENYQEGIASEWGRDASFDLDRAC